MIEEPKPNIKNEISIKASGPEIIQWRDEFNSMPRVDHPESITKTVIYNGVRMNIFMFMDRKAKEITNHSDTDKQKSR